MEGDKDNDDLPPVTEEIGPPTPPSPGRVPLPHLPPANPGKGNTGAKRHVLVPPGSEA